MSRTSRSPGAVQRRFAATLGLLAGLSVATAAVAATYSVTSLALGARRAFGLNIGTSGQAVGAVETFRADGSLYYRAFVRSESGTMTEIPTLAGEGAASVGVSNIAYGVNGNGVVVGGSQNASNGRPYAFLYSGGVVTDLSVFLENTTSEALAISNNGTVVGTYQSPTFGRAFVLTPNAPGSYALLDLGPGVANSISESGYVVGETLDDDQLSVPFVFRDANNNGAVDPGEYTRLGTLGGTTGNRALDVNDSGKVVGQSLDGTNAVHAVIWNSTAQGAVPQDLGNLGTAQSWATSINNSGQVVGYSSGYAFLYENNQLKRLASLIPTQGGVPTWQLVIAYGINNAGTIVGEGVPNNTAGNIGFLMKSGGSVTPPPTVELSSFTVTPGAITLRSSAVPATFTLALSGKTKTGIKIPIAVSLDGQPQIGFQIGIGKNKQTATATVPIDQDWTPGTYTATATYNGIVKTATLVVSPAAPITLQSLTLPTKVKRGKKVSASLSLTDVPTGTVEIPLVLLDASQTPVSFLGIPVQFVVRLAGKATATASVTIPKLLPAGTYYVQGSYGGVTKTVQFQVQ